MAAGRLNARSDADLIQASKRGDLSAFEEIYAAHAGRMKSIAFHLLADRADAEDAVQEAFLKIYRAAGAIQFDSGLAPWIYRILLNCCYDTGRKRKRQAESPLAGRAAGHTDQRAAASRHTARAGAHPSAVPDGVLVV